MSFEELQDQYEEAQLELQAAMILTIRHNGRHLCRICCMESQEAGGPVVHAANCAMGRVAAASLAIDQSQAQNEVQG